MFTVMSGQSQRCNIEEYTLLLLQALRDTIVTRSQQKQQRQLCQHKNNSNNSNNSSSTKRAVSSVVLTQRMARLLSSHTRNNNNNNNNNNKDVEIEACCRELYLLSMVYSLVLHRQTATVRDLYYSHTALLGSQDKVERILDSISVAVMDDNTRGTLNVTATGKGFVVGALLLHISWANNNINSNNNNSRQIIDVGAFGSAGMVIMSGLGAALRSVEPTSSSSSSLSNDGAATNNPPFAFILVVEKDAVARALCGLDVPRRFNCILLCGKGYPCVASREFLRALQRCLGPRVPVYCLTDCDPYGVHIYMTYAFPPSTRAPATRRNRNNSANCKKGSDNNKPKDKSYVDHKSNEKNAVTMIPPPPIEWIGVCPDHLFHSNSNSNNSGDAAGAAASFVAVPHSALLTLNQRDVAKCTSLVKQLTAILDTIVGATTTTSDNCPATSSKEEDEDEDGAVARRSIQRCISALQFMQRHNVKAEIEALYHNGCRPQQQEEQHQQFHVDVDSSSSPSSSSSHSGLLEYLCLVIPCLRN